MGKIITYNNPIEGKPNQCYCQIKFESGERILISQTKDGVTIFKLLLALIPIKKLIYYSFPDCTHIMEKKLKIVDSMILMDSFVETIKDMNSISEMVKHFK